MRSRFLISISVVLGAGIACSSAKSKDKINPAPATAAAAKDAPAVDCDAVLPPAQAQKLLPGRAVTHERSCHDGRCFADTCHYRKGAQDHGVNVLYDCREEASPSMVRAGNYFSTNRVKARLIEGLGERAAVDEEGLTFFDGDAHCLVTIRSGGDEDKYLELAQAIESNLNERSLIR